jgi:hypothetical protein
MTQGTSRQVEMETQQRLKQAAKDFALLKIKILIRQK